MAVTSGDEKRLKLVEGDAADGSFVLLKAIDKRAHRIVPQLDDAATEASKNPRPLAVEARAFTWLRFVSNSDLCLDDYTSLQYKFARSTEHSVCPPRNHDRLCVAACSMISYELVRSRYVKLTKDQDAPLEEIRPGELNQPVQSVFDVLFWGSAGVPSAGNLCLRAMNHLLMNVELLELVCIITIAELSMSALYGPLLHSWVFHLSGALGNERTPRCSDLGISVNEDLPLVQR
ncbi:hypothetical protein MUK42_27777 [Musa troglodytarum]|uniref:Uncharacterized protein n=1 Tax=Musa troglodytarum TaxID=320322 RepID=A0A9E7F6T6_9LILI|nr:hypothetical protein MUK42_27777 [Musa troglodytarum]